jgi:hypothetical protein
MGAGNCALSWFLRKWTEARATKMRLKSVMSPVRTPTTCLSRKMFPRASRGEMLTKHGHVGVITLSGEGKLPWGTDGAENRLNPGTVCALNSALDVVEADVSLHAVVITHKVPTPWHNAPHSSVARRSAAFSLGIAGSTVSVARFHRRGSSSVTGWTSSGRHRRHRKKG